eukprot:g19401.t1
MAGRLVEDSGGGPPPPHGPSAAAPTDVDPMPINSDGFRKSTPCFSCADAMAWEKIRLKDTSSNEVSIKCSELLGSTFNEDEELPFWGTFSTELFKMEDVVL